MTTANPAIDRRIHDVLHCEGRSSERRSSDVQNGFCARYSCAKLVGREIHLRRSICRMSDRGKGQARLGVSSSCPTSIKRGSDSVGCTMHRWRSRTVDMYPTQPLRTRTFLRSWNRLCVCAHSRPPSPDTVPAHLCRSVVESVSDNAVSCDTHEPLRAVLRRVNANNTFGRKYRTAKWPP